MVQSSAERTRPMTIWVFVILMAVPTFGGALEVRFQTETEEGCRKLQRVVERELKYAKYQVQGCARLPDLPTDTQPELPPEPR